MSRERVDYINNKDFLQALIDHKEKCRIAEESGLPEPKTPDYLGLCFIKLAENISHKHNFSGYTFRDELVADSILNCLQYYKNFDPEISQNPFGYFTQIIMYAFWRKIAHEKRQLYIKYKATASAGILDDLDLFQDSDGHVIPFELYDNISEFIQKYEEAAEKKKLKRDQAKELKTAKELFALETNEESF